MQDLKSHIMDLRTVFRLVPWRMRPKVIIITLGSLAVAMLDMLAVLVMAPVMELVMGTSPSSSQTLRFVARFVGTEDPRTLLVVTVVTAVVLMSTKSIATIWFRWWSSGVMARAQADALHSLTLLYTTSPWVRHRTRDSSEIYQAVNFYIPAAFDVVLNSVISLVVDLASVIMLLLALVIISPVGTIVSAVFFGGAAVIINALLKRPLIDVGQAARDHHEQSWRYLNPAIDGLKEIRLAGATDTFARRFSSERRAAALLDRTRSTLLEVPKASLEVIMLFGVLLVGWILLTTLPQTQAFAVLGVFAVAAMRIIPSLNRILATAGTIRSNLPNLTAFADIIRELESEGPRLEEHQSLAPFPADDIRFEDVSFQFPDATEPVIDHISGVIGKAQTVALVGSSGAGKTTFVELLLTLFEPTTGSITVQGRSIHAETSAWRSQLGVVVQDVFLLDASIRDNITLGVDPEEVDEARLEEAIRMAQLESVVAEAPEGLDTLVGARGTRLSGGQRQRVGIARALYRNPQVLILDEATSALDNETEARITETIQALQGKMTIIVVAHRLSTVKHADQILFFSRGMIVGRGTMDELAASNAEFAHLVELGNLK